MSGEDLGVVGLILFWGALALVVLGIIVCFQKGIGWGIAAIFAALMLLGAVLAVMAE